MKTKILHFQRAFLPVLFTLLLCVVGLTNVMAQTFTVGNLNYSLNDDGVSVTVTGHVDGTAATGELVIPENVNYYTATYAITIIADNAFNSCNGLTGSLIIPESVTSIGESAFYGCSGLTGDLTIPNSVTYIGTSAFESCSGLSGILTIGTSLAKTGQRVFANCSGFTTLNYNAVNCDLMNIRVRIDYLIVVTSEYPGGYYYNSYSSWYHWLYGCNSLTSLNFGESVERIPYCILDGCSGFIGNLMIPETVTSIQWNAFNGCSGFSGSLIIPQSVTSIDNYAFGNCNGFTALNFNATNCTSMSSSWINGVTSITSLSIGENVQRIPDDFVNGKSGITGTLTIPNAVTYIGANAFSGCSGFSGTLTLGQSVSQIGNSAFFDACASVTSFNVLAEVPPTLGNNVFISADYGMPVLVPCGLLNAYQNASGWNVFTNIQEPNPCMWDIIAAANPNEGGTVSGGGTYEQGTTCTLTATPNEDYVFVNWTEDGVEVSTDAEYSFTVESNRNLVAHFEMSVFTIMATANPSYAGEITGACSIETFDFEDNQIPAGWTNDATYPWTVVSNAYSGYNGTYCIKSGNGGVANSTSSISTTVNYADAGTVSFLGGFWGEGSNDSYNWDKCRFYIDDNLMIDYGAHQAWESVRFNVAAGNHTFTWTYKKDGSVNPTGDAFFIDDVTFTTGIYHLNETCTLTATPNEGYEFLNWTEEDEVVSTEVTYSFMVAENRMLVANFGVIVDPIGTVRAEYYPSMTNPGSPYVRVVWGNAIEENFETGDFNQYDWQVDPYYPWTITSTNPYEGQYCMKSGGAGVANVVSNMTVTVNIPADGVMSFFGKISCESSWDNGYFFIDGVQKGQYTGQGNWGEQTFPITAGDHTFQWRYTKDGSVNSNDDCFYVDYITFYKRPEPVQPGWHTYCESEFNNALGSNLTTTPSWAYEYPASFLNTNYAGWNITKVSLFSDNLYSAVGGNYTCRIYVGGNEPAAGTMVSTITVDVPSNQNAWVDWDLTTPVNVTGTDPIWVVWTANSTVSNWPAGLCDDQNDFGNWWDGGSGWEHQTYGTWTMRHWFTNRGGRSVAVSAADNAPIAVVDNNPLSSKIRTYAKGEVSNDIICANPNAVRGAALESNNTRAFSHYRVYRTNCYNDGPYDLDNTVVLACELHDTLYIDVDWPDVAPGVYKWGVGCVYVGNRGEEIETPIHWTEPMAVNNEKGNRDLTVDFESGLPTGWNVIDGNNDGLTWTLTSAIPTTWTYYASLSLDWYHGGSNAICSGSYINGYGAVTPDEYLVSPQVNLGAGSSISFWVAATDASYPADHFGVFVSDNGTSGWTSVQEWTLTAKKSGLVSGGRASRDGNGLRLGTWYNYTVDLSAYDGTKYIAFRHFNCYDQYIMCLDDISIVEGAGGPGPGPGPNPPTPGTGGTQIVDFENGLIPSGWTNDATYPWVVASPAYAGYNGTYCLMSGNSGIASSTSVMETTVTFVEAGSISFLGGCWGEGTATIWDKCQFYIDDNEQFSYGALQSWNTYSFDVTAGTHTFRWSYTKDGSVNPEGDAFFIDDITFVGVPGSGGSGGLQEPRESEIVWSNCLDKDMWLGENAVDINVLLNSADSPEGILVSFTNLNDAEQELYPIADVVLDETGFYAWDTFRKGDYQLNITRDGYVSIQENVSIWEPTSLRYVMIEIIYGVNNLYVSRTGWAMWEGHGEPPIPGPGPGPGPGTGGDSFEFGFENGFEGWTLIDNDGDGLNWVNSVNSVSASGYDYTGLAHGGNYFVYSQSYIDYDGAYSADNYLVSPQKYTIANGSTLSFWADNANDSYPDHFAIAIATVDNPGASDFVDVWSHSGAKSGEKASVRNTNGRYQNWRSHSVDLSAYAGQNVWIAFHHQDYDEYEIWIDDVTLTAGAKSNDRHLEYYKVMCESIDHEPIFNVDTPHSFCQVATDELVEGELYICKVAAVYSTGMSDYAECIWEYESCENYAGTVNGLDVNGTTVTWDYPGGGVGPGPGPGNGDSFTVDFEGGMPTGWNVIDGNNDGWTWCLTSAIPTTWEYYASLSLDWYHNGTNAICSGSYINGVGALTPDEYFVSPQVTLAAGSQLSFWAAATDASYPADHFGVFISDNGTSGWTSVQEWTLTAKKQGMVGGATSRDGRGLRIGTWYNYTVDLSSYAGQKYIAFRHFNCTDQYIMCLDDITLTAGSKSNRDVVAFNGFVTDPGAMSNGGDASWIKGSQSTFGPGCQQANGNRVGDSFTLTAATTINEIEVYGYQTGSSTTSTFNGLYAQIYNGNPMSGGQVVWGDENTNIMTATAFTNCYRGSDGDATGTTRPIMSITAGNLNIELAAGTYYLVYQLSGTGSSGPWGQPHAEPGIGNTGNGIQWLGSDGTWQNLTDTGAGTPYGCAMKITGNGGAPGPGPGPTPSGDVLGAMVFLNGEWEAFVEAPTNTYTFDEPGQYCVRIVYNGTADLPSNNFYYAMSCEECEGDTPGACEPGDPIHAEVLGATDQVRIWWGVEPAAPINEWLYYDNGTYATSIGTGSPVTVYWATMFPAADMANYAGTNLTKVAVFEFLSSSNPMTVTIHLGGTNAPGTAYSTKTYTPNVDGDFEEVTLDTPVAIDGTQNLWIVCSQVGEHPAHACADAGFPNNRWISLDGTAWDDVAELGVPGYGWMIRGFVTNQSKGMAENVAIELPAPVASTGTLSHTEVVSIAAPMAFMNRANIVKYNVYRSNEANGTYTLIGEVVEAGQTLYEYFDTPETAGTYYYQVTAVYDDGCESLPAPAFDDPTHNYVSANVDAVGENSDMVALYPNPTKDNVTIEANGMSRITVVSVLGQVVFDTELNANVYTLNMSQFNAGMYMVSIYTENGVTVKRVTVMQ